MALRLSERRQVDAFARLLDELEHDPSDLADGAGTRGAAPAQAAPRQAAPAETGPDGTVGDGPAGTGPAASASSLDSELERLLTAATALRDAGADQPPTLAEPRRAEIRARLVAATGTAGTIPAPRRATGVLGGRHSSRGPVRRHRGRRPLLIAGAGLGVVIVGTGGVTLASAGAMPGSLLYPVKRTVEAAQLDLSASPTNRGIRYLELAETRLGEVEYLLRQPGAHIAGSATENELANTMSDLSSDVSQGGTLLIGQVSHAHDVRAAGALIAFINLEQQPITALTGELPAALAGEPRAITATMHQLAIQLADLATQLGGRVVYLPGGGKSTSTDTQTAPPTGASSATSAGGATKSGAATGGTRSATTTTTSGLGLSISSTGVEVVIPGLPTISLGIGGAATTTSTATTASTNDPNPN